MRDLTPKAFDLSECHIEKVTVEFAIYLLDKKDLDLQGFAQLIRSLLNEFPSDYGVYKRPTVVTSRNEQVIVKEYRKVCNICGGKGTLADYPCRKCGMSGEIFDVEKNK